MTPGIHSGATVVLVLGSGVGNVVGIAVGADDGLGVGDAVAVEVAEAVRSASVAIGMTVSIGSKVRVAAAVDVDGEDSAVTLDVALIVDSIEMVDEVVTTSVRLISALVCCVSGPVHAIVKVVSKNRSKEANSPLPLFARSTMVTETRACGGN